MSYLFNGVSGASFHKMAPELSLHHSDYRSSEARTPLGIWTHTGLKKTQEFTAKGIDLWHHLLNLILLCHTLFITLQTHNTSLF